MTDYVELRVSSAFSFLQAASQPEDLIDRAAALGHSTLALADADGVYAVPRFVRAARAAGIRPIVGATVRLDPSSIPGSRIIPDGPIPRLLLLCRNLDGWRNLCELLSEAHRDRPKGDALATFSMLENLNQGLVALAGGLDGPVLSAARNDNRAGAHLVADRLAGAFGPDRFFLDLQRHGDPVQEHGNRFLRDLAASLRIPCVATNDVRYAAPDRARIHDVLLAIRHGTTMDEAGCLLPTGHRRHLDSAAAMADRFPDLPDVLAATSALAASLEFSLDDTGYRFPRFPAPAGETEFSLLHEWVHRGIRDRYRPVTPRVMRQVAHELDLIQKLDLAGYFLLVHDLILFCRDNDILAQGRGSAANSVVCYSLGITAVDPIGYDLLFERFLSEERGEWPDIDLDLPSGDDREKVIQYVYRRHGERSAAMTANVVTFQGRSAAREVGKVLGLDPARLERLSRLVGHYEFRDSSDGFVDRVREAGLDPSDRRVTHFLDIWTSIRDLPRHLSQHNGGMVIAGGRLDRVVPLEPARMPGRTVIQWDKDDLADLRIIKVDLLGLGMLAVIHEAVGLVRAHQDVAVDLAHLPPDDPGVFDMLRRADTVGVFQIESRAQMATLPRMRPERFYDLVVEVALIRPGPIVGRMVHPFLARRAGRQAVTYADPCLEPILARTLGVPLFQEQLMRMAMVVAGFTGGQAEELRRAMGAKRSRKRMDGMVAQLRDGMTRKGISTQAQQEIIQSIASFALYGFPESHAASFALIAYASAWLKFHHQAAFHAALLNQWPMGFYHPATLVRDAARHGVSTLPVDVDSSGWDCTMEPAPACAPDTVPIAPGFAPSPLAVRLGLKYVKGLSRKTGERIEAERAIAPFVDVVDLGNRAGASPTEVFSLSRIGAIPGSAPEGGRRDSMWQALNLGQARGLLRDAVPLDPEPDLPAMTPLDELQADHDVLGLTTGPHPATFLRPELDRLRATPNRDIAGLPDGTTVRVAGMVIVRQRPGTAKGFTFATLEDETGFANIVVTPDLFRANRALLTTAPFLLVDGRLENREGVVHVKAARFHALGAPVPHSGRNFH
jgi:error-prone DNA polymerase